MIPFSVSYGSRPKLHKDHRETIQRLFVIATLLAFEAEEIAVAGQSSRLRTRMLRARASSLRRRGIELQSIADSIFTVMELAARES